MIKFAQGNGIEHLRTLPTKDSGQSSQIQEKAQGQQDLVLQQGWPPLYTSPTPSSTPLPTPLPTPPTLATLLTTWLDAVLTAWLTDGRLR
jgi:hypothetical protein